MDGNRDFYKGNVVAYKKALWLLAQIKEGRTSLDEGARWLSNFLAEYEDRLKEAEKQ